jgi:hypothetical protein
MELTTQLKLLFLGGVLAISAAAVLLDLAILQLECWFRSRRDRALIRPFAGATDRRPGPELASERALRISHARWRMLL